MEVTVPALSERAMAEAHDLIERGRHGRLEGLAVWLAGVQDAAPPAPLRRRRVVAFGPSTVPADVTGGGTFDDGLALADREVDEGTDAVVVVSSATVGAAALVAALTGAEPVEVVANGPLWAQHVAEVRDALRRHRSAEPLDLAAHLGEPALAGFLAGAARRRTPVVIDGLATAAAALVARSVAPLCVAYLVAGHVTPHPAHRKALDALGLDPLLDLGMRADGAARLALPLLDAAVALYEVQ